MKKINSTFRKRIPYLLIYFRLLLAFGIVLLTLYTGGRFKALLIGLILIGFVADIFDGIIARKLKIDTDGLRILDSVADRIFWILVLYSAYLLHPLFVRSILPYILLLFLFDAIVYLISGIKFKKIPSAHNYLSKMWGFFVLGSFCEIILTGYSSSLLTLMILLGILSRIDCIFIYALLKNWERDIPSLYHAYQLRMGKDIRRTELLN